MNDQAERVDFLKAILVGGFIAGICDITYAIVFSHFHAVTATRVLQSVASGLLGSPAFDGGVPIAALGLLLHFCIALTWATIFFLVSRKLPLLTGRPVIAGIFFGIIIYPIMYRVVLPLSAYPLKITFTPANVARNLAVHMFFIGLPIALSVRKFAPISNGNA
jgi:hypothetical protein